MEGKLGLGTYPRRVICRYYLRGMCRFGERCRNVHEDAEKVFEKCTERLNSNTEVPTKEKSAVRERAPITVKFDPPEGAPSEDRVPDTSSLGACALSPSKQNRAQIFGPSTSTVEEAVILVKKAVSDEKVCGICFDPIMQKLNRTEQTFGILPNCNHCFCFTCIRKWRKSKEVEFEVAKACPECRTHSEFVYPSKYWVDNKEEKEVWIGNQKDRMKKLDCKYFKKGKGTCPFGNTCLYLHALPSGKILDVGPPRPRRRRPSGLDSELVHQIMFWLNDDDDDDDDDLGLDLDDPLIAWQYYDRDDIRRYVAFDRMMRDSDSSDDSDFDVLLA